MCPPGWLEQGVCFSSTHLEAEPMVEFEMAIYLGLCGVGARFTTALPAELLIASALRNGTVASGMAKRRCGDPQSRE